ncbi:hypothetical protein BG20_I2429 [Candidatus Nitrosarchaeum limnium BG20]|uniref:Uncharacterized protein n=1 Tax=Candidatus Nitrosarchaeum limnium BG20 TaxID=859192 RepID=S2E062_9ARCH|nr:hypothetical protein BG20_I2429 [Candidatus Nitrosarchaeum limnium BG20]
MKFLDNLRSFHDFFMNKWQSKGLEIKKSTQKEDHGYL